METLQSTIFIEFDVNTKKITFLRGDNIIDYDSNITNIYARVKYKNLSGNTVYLTPSELESYKFSLYTIKPATNNINMITGEITDELKENVYGGVVKFEIPRICTNRLGIVKCEIHINQGNKMIASSTFVLDVKQSLVTAFDDELLGDEDFPVLKQLILEIQKDSNIDDNNRSKITTYSSDKIETIKKDLKKDFNSQIKENNNKMENIKEDLSSQINKKANESEVRKKNESILLDDLSTEVKTAMTGGSIAVVGENAVGNENLKNNIVDGVKLNQSVVTREIPAINYLKDSLTNPLRNFYSKESLSTLSEVKDRTLSHLGITKVTKHSIQQGATSKYGTLIFGRVLNGINGINANDFANKNIRLSCFVKSNREFDLTVGVSFTGTILSSSEYHISSGYTYINIETVAESTNFTGNNGSFQLIFYEKSSTMVSDTDIYIGGLQMLVNNDDVCCVSIHKTEKYDPSVEINQLKSGLNGAYPRINELKNSLTSPAQNFYNKEKYFTCIDKSNSDFSHLGLKNVAHFENSSTAVASQSIIYLGRILNIKLTSLNKQMKFKAFARTSSSLTFNIADYIDLDSKKTFTIGTEWTEIEFEFDYSSYSNDSCDLLIYTSNINELPTNTWLEFAGIQLLFGDNVDSEYIFTLHKEDDYYNYYPKSDKDILLPTKIYSVANDLDSSRNQAVPVYVDHLLDTCFDENIVFDDTNKDYSIIEPHFEQYDKYTNAINNGVDKYTETITKKINSTLYNLPNFTTTHISTKASVGKNQHPKVLFIGDSITAGVGVRNYGLGIADKAYPYWVHCKNLFDMDKIDAGNNADEFNFTCLGYSGDTQLYEEIYREASITYKGITTSSRQSAVGMASWSLENVMSSEDSPLYDSTVGFSIKKFIEKYRTMDDDGNRLTLDSPNKGTLVTSQEFLNKINVCNPTHIVLQHGRNSEETIDAFLLALDEFINVAKTEFPNVKIGICIPPDRVGTFFPKKYPNVKSTTTQSIDLNEKYRLGRKSYDIAKAIIEKYSSNSDIELIPNFFVAPTAMGFPLRESINYGAENVYYPYFAGGLDSHPGFFAHLNWGYQVYSWIKSTLV